MAPKTKYLHSLNIYSLTKMIFTVKYLSVDYRLHAQLVIPWHPVGCARCLVRGRNGEETGTKQSHWWYWQTSHAATTCFCLSLSPVSQIILEICRAWLQGILGNGCLWLGVGPKGICQQKDSKISIPWSEVQY